MSQVCNQTDDISEDSPGIRKTNEISIQEKKKKAKLKHPNQEKSERFSNEDSIAGYVYENKDSKGFQNV